MSLSLRFRHALVRLLRPASTARGEGAASLRFALTPGAADPVAVEEVSLDAAGRVVVRGWSREPISPGLLQAYADGAELRPAAWFRHWRADLALALGARGALLAFELVFHPVRSTGRLARLRIDCAGRTLLDRSVDWQYDAPHYAQLLDTTQVFGRDHIYGSGPPAMENAADILALTRTLEGRVLDFGCGSGNIVLRLREHGCDAYGVEVDTPTIRTHLKPEARPFVTLTDGRLPLPFETGSFDGAIATEVLEHVPDWRAALTELRRVVRKRLVVTVPDAAAIPQLAPLHCVPWHLLEATHLHFFTLESLRAALASYFSRIEFYKLGRIETNGVTWYTSVGAVCDV
jgi:SAM-dependent methyltransferase